MNYSCELCNYNTDNKRYFNKHTLSQKHILNEKKILTCIICNKNFDSLKQYKNHKNYRHKLEKYKKDIILTEIITNKTTDVVKEIINNNNKNTKIIQEGVKQEVNGVKQEIKAEINEVKVTVKKALNRAANLISYLMENYQQVPELTTISDKKFNKALELIFADIDVKQEDEYPLEQKLIYEFYKKRLNPHLCKVILNLVNYKNYNKQNIYTIDSTRQNYIIKSTVWISDETGYRFSSIIIIPLLESIAKRINKYINHVQEKGKDNYNYCMMDYLTHLEYAYMLCASLVNGSLVRSLLLLLSPHLRFINETLETIDKLKIVNACGDFTKIQEELEKIISDESDDSDNNDLDISDKKNKYFYDSDDSDTNIYTSDNVNQDIDIKNKYRLRKPSNNIFVKSI